MWDFGRTPNNPPLEQSVTGPPFKRSSISPIFLTMKDFHSIEVNYSSPLRLRHTPYMKHPEHTDDRDLTGAYHFCSTFREFIDYG